MPNNSSRDFILKQFAALDGWSSRSMSDCKCHFVTLKNKELEVIDAEIKKASASPRQNRVLN